MDVKGAPILCADIEGFTTRELAEQRVILEILQTILNDCARFFSPHHDAWDKWTRHGTGDGYYCVFDKLSPAVALKYTANIRDALDGYNEGAARDLPLRMRLVLGIGDVEAVGDQLLSRVFGDAERFVSHPAFKEQLRQSNRACVIALSSLFHVQWQRDNSRDKDGLRVELEDLCPIEIIDKHGNHHKSYTVGPGWTDTATDDGDAKAAPDVAAIIMKLTDDHRDELSQVRADGARENQALRDAVEALKDRALDPNAPPDIQAALELLNQGDTAAAEEIFQATLVRKKQVGKAALADAAAAARHLGAMAFLHDTDKALAAYGEAVELDPDNANGWNQRGRLLLRIGDLDGAEIACRRVESLGGQTGDRPLLAVAYGNLGLIYRTRGDLDQAEAMHRKSLAIEEELGRKEGMASDYSNLGLIYQTRGDLDQAEAMHRKSLAIEEEFGRKEGVSTDYSNLGVLYRIRGDLDEAEAMLRKSMAIEEELGRKEGMASVYGNLGLTF